MNRAMYAGSFDPIHMGHVSIINTASSIFDEVYVVIALNTDKLGKEIIPFVERIKFIQKIFRKVIEITLC